jgi:hypothetical protein
MSDTRNKALLAVLAAGFALAAPAGLSAELNLGITDAEMLYVPTAARLQSVADAAASAGWNAVAVPLRSAALEAYGKGRTSAADAWFHAYRWAAVFSEPESRFIPQWMDAVEAAHVNYAGVAGEYQMSDRPLGLAVSPALQGWLLSNEAFSKEFFADLKDVDYMPRVLAILDQLYRGGPERFARYPSLALAIALVYDVPPPPFWPHAQVTAAALPRRFPDPEREFERLVDDDSRGRNLQRLSRLRADELKFVVDTAAPAPELAWAQQNVETSQDTLESVYLSVAYRADRLAAGDSQMVWSGRPYTLQAIKSLGGICVDQAYFATEVGKARGVPTLFFYGSGQDGRHAWFGFLDSSHHWRLDAGRYAEQRLVTGHALDPQTWTEISDHELQFLAERFRALPSYLESEVHEEFAEDFLQAGDAAAAAKAARVAVDYEPRNVEGWETLVAADQALGLDATRREGVLREAARAFDPGYPDLVVSYENRVCESLRARGETSLADFELRGLAERLKGKRDDLAVIQAAEILSRSIAEQPVAGQIATYNAVLGQFGTGSGILFFDKVVVGFAEHLLAQNLKPEARDAVERARSVLEVQPGTPFAADVDRLMARLSD